MQEQQALSPHEAARILGLSPWTIYRAIKRGEIPATRVTRGRLVIPRSYVDLCCGMTCKKEAVQIR